MDTKAAASKDSEGKEEYVIGKEEVYLCYKMIQSLAELCLRVTLKARPLSDKQGRIFS